MHHGMHHATTFGHHALVENKPNVQNEFEL
jgi:hypothetical protein